MKNIIKFIFLILAVAIAFTSCDERDYGYDDFSLEDAAREGKVFLSFVNRNFFLDYLDKDGVPTDEQIELFVRVMGPPPAVDLNVTFGVAEESTAIAGIHFTPEAESFTIKAGKSSASLKLTLHEEAFTPGVIETLFLELTGTSSPSYGLHFLAVSTKYQFMQNCVLTIYIFDGVFDLYEDGELVGEAVVSGDPETNEVTAGPVWTSACFVTLTLHEDGTLTGENQLTGGNYGPPFGFVEFEDIENGKVLNTCTGDFEFTATPTLTGGYWWGGAYHFELIFDSNGDKKLQIVGEPDGLRDMTPVKRY